MPTLLTINSITGVEPYFVYLCDQTQTTCVYIDTITNTDIPYSFEPPPLMQTYGIYIVRVIDSNPCEIISEELIQT